MLKHTTLKNHQAQLSVGSSNQASPSHFPISFPSPPPSIASFASSISTNSSFSSSSSTSSQSTSVLPSNFELRCQDNLNSDDCQRRTTLPPIPPVRHKRRQRLLLQQKLNTESHDEHLIKSSPVPAPRTSFNLTSTRQQPSEKQQWRSGSPPLDRTPVLSTNQYWTYQRQKLHKQSKFASRCHLSERPQKVPKITIKVYAQTLCQDVEYITLPIDNQTKSSQVVRMLLKKFRLRHRDPNLFYLTLERWIKKDGLPIKSVMLLGNDACPAQLQSCCSNPPHNDIKFTMLMRNGALVKIYCSDVVPDSLYKCVSLSNQTTVEESIELLLNCLNLHHNLGSDTSSHSRDSDTASLTSKSSRSSTSDQYDLIELCEATNYKRILGRDEYLVEVHQSLSDSFSMLTCNDDIDGNDSLLSSNRELSFSLGHTTKSGQNQLIIKLVRREEQQINSFDCLIKLNGNVTNTSDAPLKVSNFHLDHNSNFAAPKGIHQPHHHHDHHHHNNQQNNCLAHHNYRHYSQEQLIDDLDKLSLIIDDVKEQNGDICGEFEHHGQVNANSDITQPWNDGSDSNNDEILGHKVVLNVESSSNEFLNCSLRSTSNNDGTRACQSPIDRSRSPAKGIELYENISLNKRSSNDSSVVRYNFIADNDRNYPKDYLTNITDSSNLTTTKNSIAVNQEDMDGIFVMTELTSRGQDSADKQVLIVYYQPKIYCLSMDEYRANRRASPYVKAYENLDDKVVPSVTPRFFVPRYKMHVDS